MKSSLTASALALLALLSACTPAQNYYHPHRVTPNQPWQGSVPGWGGYRVKELGTNAFRVEFTTFNNPPMEFARTFAHARASEIALQRGYNYFAVTRQTPRTESENSHFPSWIEPGYTTEEVYVNEYVHCDHVHVEETVVVNHIPPRHHPARDVTNQIHKFTLDMRLARTPGKSTVNAYLFLKSLESKSNPWGAPPLDPATKAAMKAYEARMKSEI